MGVLDDFSSALLEPLDDGESCSPSVAAIKAIALALRQSRAQTVMGLVDELRTASSELVGHARKQLGPDGLIPVQAACERFVRYLVRLNQEQALHGDFSSVRGELLQRGEKFTERLLASRDRVASFGARFVGDGQTVLVHGYSRAVVSVLARAAAMGRHFEVIATEARPECAGYKLVQRCSELGIPVTLVMDAAVGYVMERVDLVLVGAVGILENGGVANRVGTFPVAIVAKAYKRPVYVAAESFKFSHLFPLDQKEIGAMDERAPAERRADNAGVVLPGHGALLPATRDRMLESPERGEGVSVLNPKTDYTPPDYITLIFTDLGVLTPAAVSDELINQ
jgi:translation initiation factor eIF-2B subunit alpha